jgi:hypothetical protein
MNPPRKPSLRPAQPVPQAARLSPDLVADFIRIIKDQFYLDVPERRFRQQRSMLVQAITYPAAWLAKRGMTQEISSSRYRDLINDVVAEVKRFGRMSEAYSPAHYFFKVMQTHMAHHGEEYYDECRSVRNAVAQVSASFRKAPATDSTLADLDTLYRLAKGAGGRRRVTQAAPAPQLDLFT